VTDSGHGMDEMTLARAADPFFTTKGVGRGTGLGLSMVHGLAEQSGGRLALHSRPGQGTTAEIWMRAAAHERRAETEAQAPQRPEPRVAPLTVLVVDDDPLVLVNTAVMLEDLGHQVIEASSAAQALRVLDDGVVVDLLITDQVMPGMTGAVLIERAQRDRPDFPVLLATAFGELSDNAAAAIPKLVKPFQQEALARAISAAMERASTVVRLGARRRGTQGRPG
jgi:CheY-like chemotaxis protein